MISREVTIDTVTQPGYDGGTMIGQGLLRYKVDEVLGCLDIEGEGLNLWASRPWELTHALFTLKGGIQSIRTHLIRWPNLRMEPDNPSFKHFDRARYDKEARDPREVWDEVGPLLRKHRSVFHSGAGYDSYVIGTWQRLMGLPKDYDWLYTPGVIDTNCVSKAYRAGWVPDISSPDAFLAWQYRAYHTRLPKGPGGKAAPKTKLGVMCGEFGIEYDEKLTHGSAYDVRCNVALLGKLAWAVEF